MDHRAITFEEDLELEPRPLNGSCAKSWSILSLRSAMCGRMERSSG